jgi:hypothetical protein
LIRDPQLDAFARSSDPETAHDAADSTNAARMKQLVVNALTVIGPATSEEVAAYTGEPLVSVSPRFRPLERTGVIEEAGRRKNRSGKMAIAWRVKR